MPGYIQRRAGISWFVIHDLNAPFTLFRNIYLDPKTFKRGFNAVIRHEMVHARQLHSVDLLVMEFACAILWFNPFIFLLRRYIRDNHEYLADQFASGNRSDLVNYMRVLSEALSQSVYPVYASYFTSSTLKKRIMMLTNTRSHSKKRWLYLFIIPILGVTIMSFQKPIENALNESGLIEIDKQSSILALTDDEPGIPLIFPLDLKYRENVSLNFGWEGKSPVTSEKMKHRGIDLRAPLGTPVYSTAVGTVVKSEEDTSYGKVIAIKHGENYTTIYAHLDELLANTGDQVRAGQIIGKVGSTGYSTGTHLHYEVRKNGEAVDPADYF